MTDFPKSSPTNELMSLVHYVYFDCEISGISEVSPVGSGWYLSSGALVQLSVREEPGEVWGVNGHNFVYTKPDITTSECTKIFFSRIFQFKGSENEMQIRLKGKNIYANHQNKYDH